MKTEKSTSHKLGLFGLIAVSMGTTIGSGVFSLAGDLAQSGAYTGAVILGWLVCGIGMIGLILSLFGLNKYRSDLVGGINGYAQAGWGDFIGFITTFGYWLGVVLCNVSYATFLFGAIGYFFPAFGNGANILSIVSASILFWLLAFLVCSGVHKAAFVNLIVTIAKVIPIFVFIIAVIVMSKFNWSIFVENFWGDGSTSLLDQVKGTSATTVWAFIGIEASIAMSEKAKDMKDVGKAVVTAFVGVLGLYIIVSLLSMGVIPHDVLAALPNPSMGGILEYIVGSWGASLISIGVIVSLLGAALGITMISAQIPNTAAKRGEFLNFFAKENKAGSPVNSVLFSTAIVQVFLVITYFSQSTYQFFYGISASMMMIPYFLSSLFYLKILLKPKNDLASISSSELRKQKIIATVGSIYGLWLIYSAGLSRLLTATFLLVFGIGFYIKHQKEQEKEMFVFWYDKVFAGIIIIGAIYTIVSKILVFIN
ncbi:basic amino acid/polyamine antiporter [Vagococcus fluvialis]|uniref:Amino acid permease n=1 Tax=Vagococcus fluvialis TaxID=2738 RepID=A0A7X6I3H8_9ENTE|nr:basic amino acid/polyamine antiporter [Vagococcus fluvialis]NKC68561.1 amino acid permease [Vagococcus fluvialis]